MTLVSSALLGAQVLPRHQAKPTGGGRRVCLGVPSRAFRAVARCARRSLHSPNIAGRWRWRGSAGHLRRARRADSPSSFRSATLQTPLLQPQLEVFSKTSSLSSVAFPTILTSDLSQVSSFPETTSTTPARRQFTHIVCTLGPSSRTVPQLRALLEAGMSCARFNFRHAALSARA